MNTAILVALLALKQGQQTPPVTASEDSRFEMALSACELNYKKSSSGLSFIINFDHKPRQNRVVYVATKSFTITKTRTRFIYSNVVYCGANPPTELQLLATLTKTKKIGQFYVYKDSVGQYVIRFGAHFDESLLPTTPTKSDELVTNLKDTIYFVDQVAEETAVELESPAVPVTPN